MNNQALVCKLESGDLEDRREAARTLAKHTMGSMARGDKKKVPATGIMPRPAAASRAMASRSGPSPNCKFARGSGNPNRVAATRQATYPAPNSRCWPRPVSARAWQS